MFYTDGDAQYDPSELETLWPHMTAGVDLQRLQDQPGRSAASHHHRPRLPLHGQDAVRPRVRDVDCDFRLLRRTIFDRVRLEKNSGVICLEMT